MIRPIMKDPVFLAQKSVPATVMDLPTARDLRDTLAAHRDGCVGMAANMIGVNKRIIVFDENGAAALMFNPEIVSRDGAVCDKEGCLSFPGVGGEIVRAAQVVCRYVDERGAAQTITARGYLARAIQHEVDHLDGVLYVDRMSAIERLRYAAKLKQLAKANGGVR